MIIDHKLTRHDRGPKVWGECSCGMWCWLGTYHMPKGRLATLRAEHAAHVASVASAYATQPRSEYDLEVYSHERQLGEWQ